MELYGVTFQVADGPNGQPSEMAAWVAHAECLDRIRDALPGYRVIEMGATETDPTVACAWRECGRPIGDVT